MKKLTQILFSALCLTLFFPFSAHAEEINPISLNLTPSVYLRVESGDPKSEGTLLPRTSVALEGEGSFTVLDVLEKALENSGEAEINVVQSEMGAYIVSLFGLSDETYQLSWMYAVNDELAQVAIDACEVKNGDEIVFYYLDWQDGSYAYFEPSRLTVNSGEAFTLTLKGNNFTDGLFNVGNAELMLTYPEGAPQPRNIHYTEEDGTITLTFYHPGLYTISARKSNENGTFVISRPFCEVTVKEGDAVISTDDAPIIVTGDPDPMIDDLLLEKNEESLPAPSISLFPALTVNEETGAVYWFGKHLILEEGYKPIIESEAILLPFRAVAEALGATVTWDSKTASAVVQYNDIHFSFSMSDTLNGVPVKIVNGNAYVSINYVIEQFQMESMIQFQ